MISVTSSSSASATCRASSSPAAPALRSTTASSSTRRSKPRRRACSRPATSRALIPSSRGGSGSNTGPTPAPGPVAARAIWASRSATTASRISTQPVRGRDRVLGLCARVGRDRLARRPVRGRVRRLWLRDGRVIAGMNVDVWDVNDTFRRSSAPARSSTSLAQRPGLATGLAGRAAPSPNLGASTWPRPQSAKPARHGHIDLAGHAHASFSTAASSPGSSRTTRSWARHRPDDLRQGDHRLQSLDAGELHGLATRRTGPAGAVLHDRACRVRAAASGARRLDAGGGCDGFVSVECTPDLPTTRRRRCSGERIWHRLNSPT